MKKTKHINVPKLAVELPVEMQKRSFALMPSSLKTLCDYAEFLSAHHGTAIDEDRVMEGLIAELARDRVFQQWRSTQGKLVAG